MNKKIISIILLMAIVFADISIINPQDYLANDNDYDVGYNQEEITDVYIDDVQQSIFAPTDVSTYAASKSGSWIKASNGKWWYKHSDGTYTKNGWEYIDGYWYHFDSNGYMQISWQEISGKWYHFDAYGHMDTGWKYIADYWYYFGSDGAMRLSWQIIDGKDYHFDSKGHMDTGWQYIAGYYYYFDSDGIMQTGWLEYKKNWYYLDKDGKMQTGWVYVTKRWFYLEDDGKMRTEKLHQDLRDFWFEKKGDFKGALYRTELGVVREDQKRTYWCWAASASMVGKYNNPTNRTQSDIVNKIKGSSQYNVAGSSKDEVLGIEYISNGKKKGVIRNNVLYRTDFPIAVQYIDNNKPFIVNMMFYNESSKNVYDLFVGHAYVCTGYNKLDKTIRIIDPRMANTAEERKRRTTYEDYRMLIRDGYIDKRSCFCATVVSYEWE